MKAPAQKLKTATQELIAMAEEWHREEIETNHHGDGPKCSYCRAIRAAQKAVDAFQPQRQPRKITVHVRGGVAYCSSPLVRIVDHDNR